MAEQTAAVEVWARMLCAADVHVNDGDHPTWQQLSAMPGCGQDEYRKAARWLLPRLTVGQPGPPHVPADRAERRDRYAAAMAKRDGYEWPTEFEDDEGDCRRRADAAMAVADAEQATALSVPADADLRDRIRGVIRDCPALYPDDIADRVWAALQSAYRRLLARLEADRAGHLRAAGQATEELLRIDGAVSASTLRHAAAMAVRAFEGPDAAQAYMQRTEGDPVTAVDADLRDRIEVWPLKRVLAEVQCGSRDWTWEEEWADLDRRHAETGYLAKLEQQIRENGITMPVLIGSDGRLWDGHHRLRIAVRLGIDYVPVEITPSAEPRPRFDVEAGLQRLADDLQQAECACDPAPHREDDGTYSHLAGPVAEAGQLLDERVAAAKEQQVEAGESDCRTPETHNWGCGCPTDPPHRGDKVERWLKAQRDAAADYPEAYQAADGLLDLYRLHADTGTLLDQHVCEGQAVGDCDCLEQPAVEARQADTAGEA